MSGRAAGERVLDPGGRAPGGGAPGGEAPGEGLNWDDWPVLGCCCSADGEEVRGKRGAESGRGGGAEPEKNGK